METAFHILDDQKFKNACGGGSTLDAIRRQLRLAPQDIAAGRKEQEERRRDIERRRRTHDVAGQPFEVGAASYRDLFDRLGELVIPHGPRASKDELTPLGGVADKGGRSGGRSGRHQPPPARPPPELTELVGVVGEIWAYRYLRSEFGEDVVTRACWVSEIRRDAMPPLEDEPSEISDGHGFDFRFTDRRRRTWHVEVKATSGDDSWFDLGVSEIEAARQLARPSRRGRWRILRVRSALSERPEFDWLPNPFEDDAKDLFRLRGGPVRVWYSRSQ